MQHLFVVGTYVFFFYSTTQLKRHHHETCIKCFTLKKEKALYLNQIEMNFLELLSAKHFF